MLSGGGAGGDAGCVHSATTAAITRDLGRSATLVANNAIAL